MGSNNINNNTKYGYCYNRGVAQGRLLGPVIYELMCYVIAMRITQGTTYGTSSGV